MIILGALLPQQKNRNAMEPILSILQGFQCVQNKKTGIPARLLLAFLRLLWREFRRSCY